MMTQELDLSSLVCGHFAELMRVSIRRELRAKHTPEALKSSREAHEANKSKLKSDLKKTTAFTKKVYESI